MKSIQLILILALIAILKLTEAHASYGALANSPYLLNSGETSSEPVPTPSSFPASATNNSIANSPAVTSTAESKAPAPSSIQTLKSLEKKYFWIGKCVGELTSQPGTPNHNDSLWKQFLQNSLQSCKQQWHKHALPAQ